MRAHQTQTCTNTIKPTIAGLGHKVDTFFRRDVLHYLCVHVLCVCVHACVLRSLTEPTYHSQRRDHIDDLGQHLYGHIYIFMHLHSPSTQRSAIIFNMHRRTLTHSCAHIQGHNQI